MPLSHRLLALVVVAFWSINIIIVRQGVTEMPPLLMCAVRFLMVAALIVPFTRITLRQLRWVLLASFTFGTLHFGLLFVALSLTEAGTSAVLVQLGAPISSLLACLIFREPLGPIRAVGLALTVAGVLALAQGPTFPSLLPLSLLLISASGWAVNNLIVKAMPPIPAMTLTGWTALFCAPQLALASLLLEGSPLTLLPAAGWHAWMAVGYSALVSSILSYCIWYWLLARNPVNAVVPYSVINPVFAIGLAALVFGEPLTVAKLVGTALILAGVMLVLRRPRVALPPSVVR